MDQFRRLGFTAEEAMMLNDMFQAITEANQWDWMRTYTPEEKRGFVFSDAPQLKEIDKHVQYQGHSGTSYAWTMRHMQYIAQHGLEGLAKARGVSFDWETFLREVESIPAFAEQAKALRKFERGELTYAQMRELCG
jgi:hypothetical protein